jgi:hypothetical protein
VISRLHFLRLSPSLRDIPIQDKLKAEIREKIAEQANNASRLSQDSVSMITSIYTPNVKGQSPVSPLFAHDTGLILWFLCTGKATSLVC